MTINVPLLRKTLTLIETHPDEWTQRHWRCETGMCFAGHAAVLAGGKWARPDDPDDPFMLPDHGNRPAEYASQRAQAALGLDYYQAEDLFAAGNSLDDLRRIVGELIEQAEATS